MQHLSAEQLEAGLAHIHESPQDGGVLGMIVCRPRTNEREVLNEGVLDLFEGLVGDNWRARGGAAAHAREYLDMQLNVMNSRVAALVAGSRERWALAGDQLYLDMDLSDDNLPPGTQLQLGDAVIEVTAAPHTGCRKFAARFGVDAVKFVNSPHGLRQNLRGINARIAEPGTIRVGDIASKVR